MMHLIPQPRSIKKNVGELSAAAVCYNTEGVDPRLVKALATLPFDKNGAPLTLTVGDGASEGYTLSVKKSGIAIEAEGPAGAFYAIQTLRQLLVQAPIPCLTIEDAPDFAYRGFYHDATRGKVPTLASMKELIDRLAALKINSLQLYVEHTFEFEECKELHPATGCLTAAELRALNAYCKERFIDFVPSLSTFGHLYELLEQPQYRHLRVAKDFEAGDFRWFERMRHHTVDPRMEESFDLVKSLIDQYEPCFTSDLFNICGDETFDLSQIDPDGTLYLGFIQKLIGYVQSKGKQVMMWGDILLQHPETIDQLPQETLFLNWNYHAEPFERNVHKFQELGRKQIVCPGCDTWHHFCENPAVSQSNIEKMTEYGKKYGALGVLNTNWGDWGHLCPIELSTFGTAWGAERSWNASTLADENFDQAMDTLIYAQPGATALLRKVAKMQETLRWEGFCVRYFNVREGHPARFKAPMDIPTVETLRQTYQELARAMATPWRKDEYRRALLLAAEGTLLLAELSAALDGNPAGRTIDKEAWLEKFSTNWLLKNKPSELWRIQHLFRTVD